jgi:hypothetical protein
VTGYSAGPGTSHDYATVKYDASGAEQWVSRYNGPGNTRDRARAIGVDGSGNVYVTGDSGEGSFNLSNYLTVKYDSSGVQRWTASYHNSYDYATALAVDSSGNVFVTGYSYGSGSFYDYATITYSSAGRRRWVARYHGGTGDDFASAVAVDAAGNAYVTGESVGPGTGGDYATVKYDSRGRQRWVGRYNGPGNATDVANDVVVDAAGNVYVTGESEGSGSQTDFATLKHGPLGSTEWVARYDDPGSAFNLAAALALDQAGNVHVTGRTTNTGFSHYTTIKYTQGSAAAGQPGAPGTKASSGQE